MGESENLKKIESLIRGLEAVQIVLNAELLNTELNKYALNTLKSYVERIIKYNISEEKTA